MIDDNMAINNSLEPIHLEPRRNDINYNRFNTAIINLIFRLTGKKVAVGDLGKNKNFIQARKDFNIAIQREQREIVNALNQMSSGSKESIIAGLQNISTYRIKVCLANILLEQKAISENEYNLIVYKQELEKPKEKEIEEKHTGEVPGGGTTGAGATGGAPGAPKEKPKITGGGGNSGGASSGTSVTLPSAGIKTGWGPLDTILKPLDVGLGVASMLTQALQPFAPLGLSLWTMSEANKARQQLNSMNPWGGTPYTFNFSYPGWWQPPTLPSDIINNYNKNIGGVSSQYFAPTQSLTAMMSQLSNQNMRFGLGNFGAFPGANWSVFG